MSVEPNHAPRDQPNRHSDVIQRFREEYQHALSDALTSAEMTATGGWQAHYENHRKTISQSRVDLAKKLKAYALTLESVGTSEEDEKAVKELVKGATETRERDEQYTRLVVGPVLETVQNCRRIIDKYTHEAQREERESPLHNVGLAKIMEHEIGKHKHVHWDGATGRVIVQDPGA